jgi:hypothetical protein
MGLLDPRFKYVPASSTDITATWQRHGFDARRNAERRARLLQPAAEARATTDTAEIHPLIRRRA